MQLFTTLAFVVCLAPIAAPQLPIDGLPEGTSGTVLSGGPYSLTDIDLGLGTAPDLFVIDDVSGSELALEGPSLSLPNVVSFGTHVPGPGFAFAPCKSFTLRISQPVNRLLVHLWVSRESAGNTLDVDMRLGSTSVLAASLGAIPSGTAPYYMRLNLGTTGGAVFDRMAFTASGPVDGGRIRCALDGFLSTVISFLPPCGGNALFGMLNTPCPCGNNTGIFDSEGCQSSLGFGARLRASGDASLSADSLVLNCLQLPNTWAFVVQGATYSPTGAVFGDGVSCMTGPLTRIATRHATNMSVRYPSAGDAPLSVAGGATPSSTLLYQVLYRNAAPYCTSATFNVSDGAAAVWAP